ncbi:hypothetical protein HEK62_005825 [Escherichia coli]|nr:hypothetical protein [Escherichia coli]MBB8249116.1 hypothetical protein [Escherichia coli]
MSIIIDESNEKNNGINSGLPASRDINASIRIYQQIYQHITGTTETIRQRTSENLLINIDEIRSVHQKINQLCDVHNIISKNETVTILHSKDRKEQFTSFDKFAMSSSAGSSPTISVILKYNFAILSTGASLPNHYEVTVKLASRIAMQKEMEEDAPPFIRGRFVAFMLTSSAEIVVEYADYVVARGFIEAFKEWVEGCQRVTNKIPLIQQAQRISYLIPLIMRFSFSILILSYALYNVGEYIDIGDKERLVKFLMLFLGAFSIIPLLAEHLGEGLERLIDGYTPASYIVLNKGDERLYGEYKKKRKKSILRVVVNIVSTVVLGIVSARLDKLL